MWKRISRLFRRPPDFIVGDRNAPYLLRWYVIPRNRLFNIYLHKIVRDDDDRALHDHPWASVSVVLRGGYFEIRQTAERQEWTWYRPGSIIVRRATAAHRIALKRAGWWEPIPAMTLFITGPRIREWGFICHNGWVPWQEFVDGRDSGKIGKGCGEE